MQAFRPLRILFPEGSSLSAREALSALGRQGYTIDVCDPNPWCVCRFSRFVHTFYRCPSWGTHPLEYLEFLVRLLKQERYDVLLPVHEQAFLFARVREQLSQLTGVAVADLDPFVLLQSKAAFVSLLDELDLPHPPTRLCHSRAELELPCTFPYYIKMAYGRSLWHPSLCGRPLEDDGTPTGAVFLAAITISLWPTTHPGFANFGWLLGASYPLLPSSLSLCMW